MANWNTPKQDWAFNDIVTADEMNEIGENLAYLKTREARGRVNLGATNTGSSSWTTVATINVTTRGGDVLAGFYSGIYHTDGGRVYFDFSVDGARVALNGSDGSLELAPGGSSQQAQATMQQLLTGLSAGAHTIVLQWKTNTASIHMTHGQFYAVEV